MTDTAETLPADLASAHAMILAERAARLAAESDQRTLDIEIERLKLEIARLKRERYGQSAERSARIEQLELSLEDMKKAPIAIEAATRIDALFAIERDIAGLPADQRLAVRADRSRPLVDDLATWLHAKRASLSGKSDTAKAMDYLLKRWPAFTLFLDDGRVDLSNNAAERALRGIAVGRKN